MNTMHIKDACKVLGITGEVTPEISRVAYRKACSKYHPDKNPGGLEMMKAVNLAYEALKDVTETIDIEADAMGYGDELMAAINAIVNLPGLDIELCGSWLWVSGETKRHKDVLKASGFRYAGKKKKWSFHPADFKSWSRGKASMDDIRSKYGSRAVRGQGQRRISAG